MTDLEPGAPKTKKILVDFEPVGRRIEIEPGTDLLTAAQQAGVDLVAACSGMGICGTCMVRLVKGELTPVNLAEEELLEKEQLASGSRLACQSVPLSDMRIDIPPESLPVGQKLQVDAQEVTLKPEPVVLALDVALAAPTLEDLRSDHTRLNQAVIEAGHLPLAGDLAVYTHSFEQLRRQDWKGRAVLHPQAQRSFLVTILPQGSRLLGLAVDMGSTKLALYLVDLASGGTLARMGVMNPQISYGEDVISRIAFANRSPHNRRLLQTRMVETLNESIAGLCQQAGVSAGQIVDAVLVGNTAMHHFFTGLPVTQLGASPYVPAVSDPLDVRAVELGLQVAPGAWLHLPANVAGYVGADHTSALLAAAAYARSPLRMLVDIGTNTEISLTDGEKVYSCSTASGPAFEGAHIHDGMRAAPGAIERVRIRDGSVQVMTVGGQAPVGICGTGILNAISELLEAGAINAQGTIMKDHPGVRRSDGRLEYLLVPAARTGHGRDIIITRRDVNEIQLAKGAIRAGQEVLLSVAGIRAEDVQEWIIAGAFGTYLDIESALRVGMFPPVQAARFHQIGNAAGAGAKRMLLSRHERQLASQIAAGVNYIELTVYPEFTRQFVEAMHFKV